jgi:Zn-dependent metalloprotease
MEPDVTKWNWLVGDGLSSEREAFRSMKDPTKFGQPKHMRDFARLPNTEEGDHGGVHKNSGIHNFAAYNVMAAKVAKRYVFRPAEVAAIFYITVSQHLSRQSVFADSRRGALIAAQSLFRKLPPAQLKKRIKALEGAFDKAGIG